MSRDFTPVYSSTSDGPDITLCRILEAVSVISPQASNGALLPYTLVSASGTNATVVKASPGRVFNFIATNVANQTRYVKFYDKATTPNPTSDSPDYILPLQNGQTITLALGVAPFVFHNGISFAIVTSASGGGSVGAGDVVLSLSWI
jgi:hypothetical protein